MMPAKHQVGGGNYSKYRNVPVEVGGQYFHSEGELKRWRELEFLQKADHIHELRRQVRFELHAGPRQNLRTIGVYVADFVYVENTGSLDAPKWRLIVEDFKGYRTELYKWKKKHLELEYDLTVRESTDGRRRHDYASPGRRADAN